MELPEYKNIYENEDTHFFYVGNHEIILSLLRRYKPQGRLTILDAGCGTGLLTKKLNQFGKVLGIDNSPEAIKFAKMRKIRARLASVTGLPFPTQTFDVVISIDVLYHSSIKNDLRALKEFHRVLKQGGLLILRVPANKWLTSSHDRYVHTRERYSKKELIRKLAKTGFLVRRVSFVNMILFPLALVTHFFEILKSNDNISSGVHNVPRLLNRFLTTILITEKYLLQYIDLPFGLGLIAVCKKKL